jgi:outer membrane protein OmpA-like peptidoglycan-associated protein
MKNNFPGYIFLISAAFLLHPGKAAAQRKTFKSPPVYAVSNWNTPDTSMTKSADTSASVLLSGAFLIRTGPANNRDSLLLKKMDSLTTLIRSRAVDRPTDSAVLNELTAMRSELHRLKLSLEMTTLTARVQQLRYQEDSIRQRRAQLLAAYPAPRKETQQLQLYELQLDSLHAERQALFTLSPRSDTSASFGPYPNPGAYPSIDMLQRNDSDPYPVVFPRRDTVVSNNWSQDSTILYNRLQRSSDSVAFLQRRLGVFRDSANFYRRQADTLTVAAMDSAVSVKKKKWYQRIFTRPETPVPASDQYAYRQAGQQAQQQAVAYTDQAGTLEAQITDLQRRNNQLQREYDRIRLEERDHRPRLTLAPPPVRVVENEGYSPGGSDRGDIREMRRELEALRVELNNATHPGGPPPAITANVIPAQRVDPNSASPQDTAQLNGIRQELAKLQQKMDSLHTAPAIAPPGAVTTPDIRHYPPVSLYFLSGAVSLPEDQIAKLTPLAAAAGDSGKIKLSVRASTDGVGSRTANQAVALKRTEYVRSVLIDRFGIEAGRLKVLDPMIRSGATARKQDPLDRRVDVRLSF